MQVSSQFPEQESPKCPRCDSADTKFCYYNNYNLSQPRHFCRSCKRYWTKGGALRNIPVGGGSRKTAAKRTSPFSPAADAKRPAVAASVSACNDSSNKKNNNGGGEMAETLIFGEQFGNFMDACGNFKGEFGNLLDGLVPIDDDDDSSLLISGDREHFVDPGSAPNVDPRNGLESVSSGDADGFLNIHGGVGDGICWGGGNSTGWPDLSIHTPAPNSQ